MAAFHHSEAIRLMQALAAETDAEIEASLLAELEKSVESGKQAATSFIAKAKTLQDQCLQLLSSAARHRAELLLAKVFAYADSTWEKCSKLKLDQISKPSSPVPVNSDLTDALMQGAHDLGMFNALYQDIDQLVALIGDGADLNPMVQRDLRWKPTQAAASLLYFAGELVWMQRTLMALNMIGEHAQYAQYFERDIEPRLSLFGNYLLELLLRISARMNTHLSTNV